MDSGPIGKFQVLSTLGKGANSSILHIRRDKDSRQYALKVVPITGPDDRKYLIQAEHEFRVAQLLRHPSLIQIYRLEKVRDWLFRVRKVHLLIEYVHGQTLDKVKGLTVPRLLQIFARVADGMVHMHRCGVYHADLKPNNILLSRTGEVKIIDFGLAWIRGENKHRVQGTPEYMAPEQVKQSIVTEQTDIYNFGATMYRLLTWELPPSCLNTEAGLPINSKTFAALLKPVQELAPAAPKKLCDLIQKCLSYKPQDRPQHMQDVQAILQGLVEKMVRKPEDHLEAMEW